MIDGVFPRGERQIAAEPMHGKIQRNRVEQGAQCFKGVVTANKRHQRTESHATGQEGGAKGHRDYPVSYTHLTLPTTPYV